MLSLGALAFVEPALLAALLVLPLIWWLLRLLPPAPRRLHFPAIQLLFGLRQEDETPDRTPLWLLLLRLVLAAALIVGLAHPLLHPSAGVPGNGPLLLVVDDGWGSARHWTARHQALEEMLEHARRDRRPVAMISTALPPSGESIRPPQLVSADEALRSARTLAPRPWPPDYRAAVAALEGATLPRPVRAVWLSDGLAGDAAQALAERLQRLGSLTVLTDPSGAAAHLIRPPERMAGALQVTVERAPAALPDAVPLRLVAADGRLLGRLEMRFAPGDAHATGRIELPGQLLNEGAALKLDQEASAGGTFLLDDAWRRRLVGLVSNAPSQAGHPLLEGLHYLATALGGIAETRRGPVKALIEGGPSVVVLDDAETPTPEEHRQLRAWVEAGGLLIRFAGPHMTEVADDLLPVTLRRSSRALGGPLSWEKPQPLAAFPAASPFAGLAVPSDVTVSRQVLAEPSPDLEQKTWATLADGTPLVTSAAVGRGRIVLFHVADGPEWSNLPISGLFPQMLQRLVSVSHGSAAAADRGEILTPLQTLDGLGHLGQPPASARPITAAELPKTMAGPAHPPGFYGPATGRRALNLGAALPPLAGLDRLPSGVARGTYGQTAEVDLKPPLLLLATLLALADLIASLWLRGHMPRPGRRTGATAAGALLLLAWAAAPGPARAADVPDGPDNEIIEATTETHLAYVLTGNREIDETSRAGMLGLSHLLARRTSVEPAAPTAIDIEHDEILFYPLLYWPIDPAEPPLSDAAKARITKFLETGGTILFDTRDQEEIGAGTGGTTPQRQRLRLLTHDLPIPPLAPIPPDHVLTRAFYLIHSFPGRWAGGTLWVEPQSAARLDGVPTVMVGGNDWAAAWAIDGEGRPLFPVVPGGEPQREAAFRFGINLVMHVLTGNYKADQVHVPALLRRLGE